MVQHSDSKPKNPRATQKKARPSHDENEPVPQEAASSENSGGHESREAVDEESFDDGQPQDTHDYSQKLSLTLTRSLHRKVVQVARDEGVSIEEFLSELVAEGVVIRAWEIAERKSAMRGGGGGNSYNQGRSGPPQGGGSQQQQRGGGGGGGGGGHNRKGYRGMSQNRYQAIMEDKASFVEYVRSQERTRR